MVTHSNEWWQAPEPVKVDEPVRQDMVDHLIMRMVTPAPPQPERVTLPWCSEDHENSVSCVNCDGLRDRDCGGHVFGCQDCSECEFSHSCRDCLLDPDCNHVWQCSECGGKSSNEEDFG